MQHSKNNNHYVLFATMIAMHFVAMYAIMYAMVDVFANVIPNINTFYMAALMTTPMILIELTLMGFMYGNKKVNLLIAGIGALVLVFSFAFIRLQFGVDDKAFLRSMIPHHAGAILMCEKAALEDPEVIAFCDQVIENQQAEIDFMKGKLGAF